MKSSSFPNDLFTSRDDCVAAMRHQAAQLAALAERDGTCPRQGQRWVAATLAAEIGVSLPEAEALLG